MFAVAVAASSPARGELVCGTDNCTDTASFAGLLTDLHGQPLRVSKFDLPSAFTLERVLVRLSGGMNTGGSVTNLSPNINSFSVQMFAVEYSGTAAGDISLLPQTQNVLDPYTSIHGPQDYENLAPGETAQFGPGGASSGVLTIIDSTDIAVISEFVDDNPGGTDTFGYDFNSLIATSFSGGGGNFSSSITTTADAELSVTYFFSTSLETSADELPAPGGFFFLVIGIALMGLHRVRAAG